MFDIITNYAKKHRLIKPGSTIIVGLSGGPDSVFLLHYLVSLRSSLGLNLVAAHLDHEWRSDSQNDVKFCAETTQALGVPLHTQKISELSFPVKFNGSQEEYARNMRRHFFNSVAKEHNADAIALAHHQDDQQETFFIRLVRGASLTGLTGMRPKHDMFIRPLLETSKKDIVNYLDHHGISYLTDPTNDSCAYLRNRIRSALPSLKKTDKRFDQNFSRALQNLQKTETFLQELAQRTFETMVKHKNSETWVDINRLFQENEIMMYRILIYWLCSEKVPFTPSEKFFKEMVRFLKQQESKTHAIHQTWSIEKKKNYARIIKH